MRAHLQAAIMSTRNIVPAATRAASLAGCVDRGDWRAAPRLEPQALGAQQALADARLDAAAWPADLWWQAYGDPQLDALIAEALAGSPSLAIAQARLRAAQAQALAAGPPPGPGGAPRTRATPPRIPGRGRFPLPLSRRALHR